MKLNLLKRTALNNLGRGIRLRRSNRWVLTVAAGLFVLSLFGTGGRLVYYKIKLLGLKKETTALEAVYQTRADEVVRYVRIKNSLQEIKGVLDRRIAYQRILHKAYLLLSPESVMVDVSFAKDNVLVLTGRAIGIRRYDAFVESLLQQSQQEGFIFSNVIQSQLTRQLDGGYVFNLQLLIADG